MENTQESSLQDIDNLGPKWSLAHIFGHFLGGATAIVWRWGNDRRAVAAFVGRYSAHLAILTLALLVGLVGRIAFAPVSVENGSFGTSPLNGSRVGFPSSEGVAGDAWANCSVRWVLVSACRAVWRSKKPAA